MNILFLVKGFRRSVDDVGYELSDKNEILLKIVDNAGVPRIEIKLRATNGYSKQQESSKMKLNNKAENETLNFYIQVNNVTLLNNLPVELRHSSNDIDGDYHASETSVLTLNENDSLQYEATRNSSRLPLNELHYLLLTSNSDASTIFNEHTTQQISNITSIRLVNNLSMISNEITDTNETDTIKTFHTHNNLTRIGCSNMTAAQPEVSNADQLLDNVNKYRKIFSHSFYQRDKSEPDVTEDVSQVTSDFLLHFLPLVVPRALPRSVNLKSLSNNSNNEYIQSKFKEHTNLLSSPIVDKIITVPIINTTTSLPRSDYDLNNNIKIIDPKIYNQTIEHDNTTSDFQNIMSDSTTATDIHTITFLRKYPREALTSFSVRNMAIDNVTPLVTNLREMKILSFSDSAEIKYNVTSATLTPRVEEEVNVGFPKGNNSSILLKLLIKRNTESVAATQTIKRQSKNFNMFSNRINTTPVYHLINGRN